MLFYYFLKLKSGQSSSLGRLEMILFLEALQLRVAEPKKMKIRGRGAIWVEKRCSRLTEKIGK